MTSDTAVLPAPPKVRSKVAPVIGLPEAKVKVPASELIRAAEPSVTTPDTVLAPTTLRKAPPPRTPVPLSVSASATVMPPCSDSVAPASTVVPPALVPSAAESAATSMPAATVVTPV